LANSAGIATEFAMSLSLLFMLLFDLPDGY
jgi:hypothetical protein